MKKIVAFILIMLIIYLIGPFIMWERSHHQNSVFYDDGKCVTVDSVWLQERSTIERPYQFVRTNDGRIRVVSQPKYKIGDMICQ
jgi:hypothetical protein